MSRRCVTLPTGVQTLLHPVSVAVRQDATGAVYRVVIRILVTLNTLTKKNAKIYRTKLEGKKSLFCSCRSYLFDFIYSPEGCSARLCGSSPDGSEASSQWLIAIVSKEQFGGMASVVLLMKSSKRIRTTRDRGVL